MKINLPKASLPKTPTALPTMEIEFKPPNARIPGYIPMVIPPSDLEAPEGEEITTYGKVGRGILSGFVTIPTELAATIGYGLSAAGAHKQG